jgi:hypothetical protein
MAIIRFEKNEQVVQAGEEASFLGIILEGSSL